MNEAATALHEAGHAVVATALGRRVASMRLAADGGTTTIDPPTHRNDRRARLEWTVILAAGEAAERSCAPPTPTRGGWRL